MGLVVPLGEFVQLAGDKAQVSCSTKPGVAGVHEIAACPPPAGIIVSMGALVPCTAVGNTQNPPVIEYCPFVIGPPASGWPIVPLTE